MRSRTNERRKQRTRRAAVFLMAVLSLSVAIIGMTTATANVEKFFLALFLQYVDRDAQVDIYKPNMSSKDHTRKRVQNDDTLKSDYVTAAKSLPGPAGMSFKSSQQIVENAKRVKDVGFNAIHHTRQMR